MNNKKSRIVCLTLVFILLFLGMSSQEKKTHSILVTLQHISQADTIEKIEAESLYIGNCTSKLITGLRDTVQNTKRGQSRINLRSSVEFLSLEECLQIILSCCFTMSAVIYQIKGSDITILEYIHSQDGEK